MMETGETYDAERETEKFEAQGTVFYCRFCGCLVDYEHRKVEMAEHG
jgi:hypothetical protein